MALEIATRETPRFPVDLPALDYSRLGRAEPSAVAELAEMSVQMGKDAVRFGDLFRCRVVGDEALIVLQGETRQLHSVGRNLAEGAIRVEGSVGDYAGANLRGGRLDIQGSAGHWLAADCRGGVITVAGDCGGFAAASRPGQRRGITGGTIMVQGSAGAGVGRRMRRGVVVIGGDTCDLAPEMLAGTIVVVGQVSGTVGHLLKRGTLVCVQGLRASQTLNMQPGIAAQPIVWRLLLNHLARHGHTALESYRTAALHTYHLDRLTGLRGELWAVAP